MELFRFDNCARPFAFGIGGYYKWKVFLDVPQGRLNQVKGVEYRLDETFPNPIRYIEDRKNKFALSLSGRKSFMIHITIYLINEIDGKTEINTEYFLDLTKSWDRCD